MTQPNAKTSAKAEKDDKRQPTKSPPQRKKLPPYRVLLHNDDRNSMDYVTRSIFQLTPLNWSDARARMHEAHLRGVALVLSTHKERAELYEQQLRARGLCVTIEPDSDR